MVAIQIWQSQNFLKRPEYVSGLIDKTDLTRNDLVVEIGPGKGIITKKLADKVGQVVAVEVDHKLANSLRDEFKNTQNVKIAEADFLKWQLPQEEYKIFSNIPFNMTADIVRKITTDKNPPQSAYLIMQDKAALRFMGKPIENQTSILLKPWFDIKILENINRNEFTPIPNVNAVLAEIAKKENPQIDPKQNQWYRDFVIYGYNQWQPTILDSYKNIFTSKQRSIAEREIMLKGKKPSELSFEQWLKLFDTFNLYVPNEKKAIIKGAETKLEKQQSKLQKMHRTR
jgi:23S rRNA (adenine-N6)-dimethyltransferase